MTPRRRASVWAWPGHEPLSMQARLLLAAVFIAASIHKIVHPEAFALNVATYQILPLSLVNLQAIGLPWVEMIVGLALLAGLWTRESALVTIGMNLMFIVAISITLARGEDIACGCFASAEAGHQIDWTLAARDAGLVVVGVYLVAVGGRWLAVDRLLDGRKKDGHERHG